MMDLSREEILRRFTRLLDRALSSEEPPSGIDSELLTAVTAGAEEEDGCDSYALWAAMTTLAQEVKLQGRSFKELSDSVGAQPARTAEEIRAAFEQAREREREVQRATEHRCRKEALGVLIDLRDRMVRGLESVRAAKRKSPGAARPAGSRDGSRRNVPRPGDPTTAMLSALNKGYEL